MVLNWREHPVRIARRCGGRDGALSVAYSGNGTLAQLDPLARQISGT
ncbi:hypothetical protein [Accumulibacter sp.]|nr:hypothetical protein [Accumulibacter sp.]